MAKNLKDLSLDEKKILLASFDSVITDCDGVLWHGKVPVEGAQSVLNSLTDIGKKRYYFSNNSTLTRKQYLQKFLDLGFSAFEDEILSTAWLTAIYLKNNKFNKKVYVIGPNAVKEELNSVGIDSIGVGPDNYVSSEQLEQFIQDPEVGAVVAGYDFYFSYPKLYKACCYLSDPNCLFIATNKDERFPVANGFKPGSGTFVAALETCSERKALVIGKPSPLAVDSVLVPKGLVPDRCLMIGDRCNTDIQFGNESGMKTLMVETGVHKYADIERFGMEGKKELVPTYYCSSIADLTDILHQSCSF